jgi:hypothetical protein
LYVPGATPPDVTFRIELPEPPLVRVTVAGLKLVWGAVGEIAADSEIEPESPLILVNVRVVVPEDPWTKDIELGFADIVKSGTVIRYATVAERETPPLVPVTNALYSP